jgi:hypothetical protein
MVANDALGATLEGAPKFPNFNTLDIDKYVIVSV